jgi:hypothetical protein
MRLSFLVSGVLAAALSFSQAFADAKVLAKFGDMRVPKTDRSLIERAVTLEVLDNGIAKVQIDTYQGFGEKLSTTVSEYPLSFAVVSKIKESVIALSNAELEKKTSGAVCEILVPEFGSYLEVSVLRGYDNNDGQFKGQLTPTLRKNGCYDPIAIYPIDSFQLNAAFKLQGQMEALSLQLLTGKH